MQGLQGLSIDLVGILLVKTPNIYAGSDLQSHTLPTGLELQYVSEFVERTSGSCLDNKESQVRPVLSKDECLFAQYDASAEFSQK